MAPQTAFLLPSEVHERSMAAGLEALIQASKMVAAMHKSALNQH